MDNPLFDHDCTVCQFLGSYEYDAPLRTKERGDYTERIKVDLWFCGPAIPFPTCIARFSSEGSDYSSCPVELIERDILPRIEKRERVATASPAIAEAYRRAKEAKLC